MHRATVHHEGIGIKTHDFHIIFLKLKSQFISTYIFSYQIMKLNFYAFILCIFFVCLLLCFRVHAKNLFYSFPHSQNGWIVMASGTATILQEITTHTINIQLH